MAIFLLSFLMFRYINSSIFKNETISSQLSNFRCYMNIKELKEGEIYKCDNETILKWGKNDSTENIDLIDCKFNTTKGHYINGEFTKANDREIHWFNKCSELGKYITYEKAMETYKEEFIVGKWYKVPSIYDNFYIKYKETKETIGNTNRKGKYYTEVIDKGEYTKKYDWICNGHKIEPLKNLSEIQQYLPKDHPDKTPVIDSWCIQVTNVNREIVKKWYDFENKSYSIGAHYGINKKGKKDCESPNISYKNTFDKLLTTEEFYNKIGHLPIKTETIMFKKDDYIVLLKGGTNLNLDKYGYKSNVCYKLKQNYFVTYEDSKGNKYNGWDNCVKPDDPLGQNKNVDGLGTGVAWRYATKEEIAEYNRINKPFDVTTLIQETMESFAILLNSQEELNSCISWAKNKNIKEFQKNNDDFNKYTPCYFNYNPGDGYWCYSYHYKYPHKTLSELGIIVENSIPEYVECIKNYGSSRVGQIFNTKNEGNSKVNHNLSWYEVLIKCKRLHESFKPSTKEAYAAQFNQEIEIGDEVKVLVNDGNGTNKKRIT